MENGFLKYKNSQVHFLRFGNGPKLLIALHGFADQASLFLNLRESLEENYVVYSLDLPFHGKSQWGTSQYTPHDIGAIFQLILDREKQVRLDLMGFSLGGKIVQKMLFDWITRVDKVYLVAPYGLAIRSNFPPPFIKQFFQRIAKNPNWLIRLSKGLHRLKLLSRFHQKFVYHHLHTPENQIRLFGTWCSLDHFKFHPKTIKKFLEKNPVKVELYFGTQDKIIPASQGKVLADGLDNVDLYLVEGGHLLINQPLNELLKKK